MKFGVLLPNTVASAVSVAELIEISKRAEELGFDDLLVGDHIVQSPQLGAFGGVGHYDAFAVLGAVGAATETIGIGTCVAIQVRHPLDTVQSIATVAGIAPGRFRCGLGIGGFVLERAALGFEPRGGGKDLDRVLELLDTWPTNAGEFDERLEGWGLPPRPAEPIDLWIGGSAKQGTKSAARIVGQATGWAPAYLSPDAYREQAGELDAGLTEAGRPLDSVTRSALLYCCLDERREDALASARELLVPSERAIISLLAANSGDEAPELSEEELLEAALSRHLIGSPEDIAAHLARLRDAGMEHIVIGFLPATQTIDKLELFMRDVAPALQD